MADLDSAKDFINNIRLYMSISVAVILAIGSGIAKMYNASIFNYLFYAGNILLFIFILLSIYLAKALHKKTLELKDL